jgi:hypothetical protein
LSLGTLLALVSGTSLEGPVKKKYQQEITLFLLRKDLAQREATLRVGQISLAQLIEELESLPPDAGEFPVAVQDNCRPLYYIDGYGSYRGFYSEMALESSCTPSHTLSSLLRLLKGSLHGYLFGYKGGNILSPGKPLSGFLITGFPRESWSPGAWEQPTLFSQFHDAKKNREL